MAVPKRGSALVAGILAQARSSPSACVQDYSLKELAWAYVHGASRGTEDEKLLEQLLVAKAKES